MLPTGIVDLFSNPEDKEAAYEYLDQEGLIDIIHRADPSRISPDYRDLARLHKVLRERKVFTVLEFGIGFSTIVLADALQKNKRDFESASPRPKIRNETPFEVHSVDAAAIWIEKTKEMLPDHLLDSVHIQESAVVAGTFQSRACHFYEALPDVVPDFIYLDGPDPADVHGTVRGLTWRNPDRCVMAGDILLMEPTLLPGTLIMVDGRTANSLFLSKHFYRNWEISQSYPGDVTTMELQDPVLGKINRETLLYCLGERILQW